MPLHLGQKNNIPGRRVTSFVLASLLLLLAIGVMVAWMVIRFHQSTPPTSSENSDTTSQYEDPLTAVDSSLIIFDAEGTPRFVLVQTDPARLVVNVAPIPANITDEQGNTLPSILAKHGSMKVTQTVSAALELPIAHYIAWTVKGAQTFLNELDTGMVLTLPEPVAYTDENGITVRLQAGEQTLTGTQAAAVLQFSAWQDASLVQTVPAQIVAAALNQYLVPEQQLDGYFAALADSAQTDLRIDNYNGFRRVLSHLSLHNTGALCRIVAIEGENRDGTFIPNIDAMKEQSILFP